MQNLEKFMSFKNKIALVTGAGTGNGEAIAEELFLRGATVILSGKNGKLEREVASRLDPSGKRAVAITSDMRNPEDVRHLVEKIVQTFGALHLAVNNAGITGSIANTSDYSIDEWNEVIATDLTGTFLGMKFQIPAIIKSGGGSIVNLSSANGIVGVTGLSAYTAAKHGIIGLTKSAALEYAKSNIRINAIGPGYVATQRMLQTPKEILDSWASLHPMGRLAEPKEVAKAVAFLLSEDSSFMTGAFVPIDGGYTAQ